MGDMGDMFRDMKEHVKQVKAKRLDNANDEGWNKHTDYHWHMDLNGKRLDYWPSTGKFQYNDKIMQGGINGFIKKRLKD